MTNFIRMTSLAASVAALTLTATPALAAPSSAGANPAATARAQIVKPLTLVKVTDLDFGTIVVQDGGTATMTQAGALSCTAVNLTCAATGTPAEYKVTGTNNQVVHVTKPDVTLTNQDGSGTTLTLVLDGPADVTLPNSGASGTNFKLGGSINIAASTREGVYSGNMLVTVQY
jgi:hypothetical protein